MKGNIKIASWRARTVWIALALAACLLEGPAFLLEVYPRSPIPLDFFQEWASARNYLTGYPLYTDHSETIPRYLHQKPFKDRFFVNVNAHPPMSILVALPLGYFDYALAFRIWNLLSIGLLLLSIGLVVYYLPLQVSVWSLLPLVALLLFGSPIHSQIYQGQINPVLLLLIILALIADRSHRPYWAGTMIGLAALLKLFPAFLFFYFVLRGRWQSLVAGVLTGIAGVMVSAAILGIDSYETYIFKVLPQMGRWGCLWSNLSLLSLWNKLFNPEMPIVIPLWTNRYLAIAVMGVSALFLSVAIITANRWVKSRVGEDLLFGLSIIAMLLLCPTTWQHYFVLLLLPLALLWYHLPATGLFKAIFWVTSAVLWLIPPPIFWFLCSPIAIAHPDKAIATPWQVVTWLSIPLYALLCLFTLNMMLIRKMYGNNSLTSSAATSMHETKHEVLHFSRFVPESPPAL